MQFLMFSMLAGLGAIAIPIVIHLLHRQKTTPIAWGAMQFLIQTVLQHKRRRKIEHWLLMAARCAIMAFLALLLARPIMPDKYNPLGAGASSDIAIVLDHSLSTGRRSGQTTLFEQGVALADRAAGLVRGSDTFSVVLAEHMPRKLTELPVLKSGVDQVRKNLHALKPGLTDANIAQAVGAAREMVSHGSNVRKVIVVISDAQRSNWDIENQDPWKQATGQASGPIDKNVSVYALPLSLASGASNVSVGPVIIGAPGSGQSISGQSGSGQSGGGSAGPGLVGVNRPTQISAVISNSSSEPVASLTATLVVDGKTVATQQITDLPADGTRTARFDFTFTQPGSHWAKISIEHLDALQADNSSIGAVEVLSRLPVLIIDGQLTNRAGFKSSQFLAAAMRPDEDGQANASLIEPKVVSVLDSSSQSLDDYAAVVVNDVPELPSEMPGKLAEYARGGKGVWIILGPRTTNQLILDQLGPSGLFPIRDASIASGMTDNGALPAPGIDIREPNNPMVSLLSTPGRNGLAEIITARWWSIHADDAGARTVLASPRGNPLVLERSLGNGGGQVVLWASSADAQWNNWPLVNSFVPLVNETILHLCSSLARASQGHSLEAGKPIVWSRLPGSPVQPILGAEVIGPDGNGAPAAVYGEGAHRLVSYQATGVPGLYQMRFTPSTIPQPVYYAVGIDPREEDAQVLSEADYSWLSKGGYVQGSISSAVLDSVLGASSHTVEMWPYLAFGVLGLLLIETWMTWRMARFSAAPARAIAPGVAAGLAQTAKPSSLDSGW